MNRKRPGQAQAPRQGPRAFSKLDSLPPPGENSDRLVGKLNMANFPKPPTLNDDERAVDIYRKAAKIFRSKGFDATSMGDIAEAVDLTKGGLYYYIKGKEALLFAIMSFAMSSLETRVVHPVAAVADPEDRLARMIAAHVVLALDEPASMLVLADEDEGLNAQHRRADARAQGRNIRRPSAKRSKACSRAMPSCGATRGWPPRSSFRWSAAWSAGSTRPATSAAKRSSARCRKWGSTPSAARWATNAPVA